MSTVHYAHQDKGLYFTEISGGGWATDFSDNLMWFTKNIFIGTALNWSKNALLWNLVLDQSYGPTNNGCQNCRGVVTLNTTSRKITKNEEYYAIAHFSKFVRPGAVRISAPLPVGLTGVSSISFQNPDGSKAMILCNEGTAFQTFTVNYNQKYFSYSLAPQAVVSLVW
jgi:glucosylceramidase